MLPARCGSRRPSTATSAVAVNAKLREARSAPAGANDRVGDGVPARSDPQWPQASQPQHYTEACAALTPCELCEPHNAYHERSCAPPPVRPAPRSHVAGALRVPGSPTRAPLKQQLGRSLHRGAPARGAHRRAIGGLRQPLGVPPSSPQWLDRLPPAEPGIAPTRLSLPWRKRPDDRSRMGSSKTSSHSNHTRMLRVAIADRHLTCVAHRLFRQRRLLRLTASGAES